MPRTRKSRSHLALGLALFLTQACVHAAGEGAGHRQTVRLLTVGNSFSTDATRFLGDLARAGGHVLVHHEVAIPGGTLSQHWEKAERNRQDPSRPEGLYETGVSLRQELRAEPWDFVTIQQASKLSHDASTYRPYASLLHHLIHENARGAEILVHETWAYRVDDRRFVGRPSQGSRPRSRRCTKACRGRTRPSPASSVRG